MSISSLKTIINVSLDVASGLVREPYALSIPIKLNFPTLFRLCNLLGPGVQT
jgi:hypothetical protein